MCILALYFRQLRSDPLIVAANRDEFYDRPSAPPQVLRHGPLIVGGKDLRAGGTWLGVNECGLVVGILNRRTAGDNIGDDFRSRGLLCLDLLEAKDPAEACARLRAEKGSGYRPFNLLLAGPEEAYAAYNLEGKIVVLALSPGLHVLGNGAIDQTPPHKITHARAVFSAVTKQPFSEESYTSALKTALSDHSVPETSRDARDSICVHGQGRGTVSSTLIFYDARTKEFRMSYAPGPPCREDHRFPMTVAVR